jgi:hypothetical protein
MKAWLIALSKPEWLVYLIWPKPKASFYLFIYLFIYFSTGVWTQGLMLKFTVTSAASLVIFPFSIFVYMFFVCLFFHFSDRLLPPPPPRPTPVSVCSAPISTSQVAGITGVSLFFRLADFVQAGLDPWSFYLHIASSWTTGVYHHAHLVFELGSH